MSDETIGVLCIGESMAVAAPDDGRPLTRSDRLGLRIGGAESNVALHLLDQGIRSAWASRLGADAFGSRIRTDFIARGLDVSAVQTDPDAPTGLYFKDRREDGSSSMVYYRAGSAASRMSAADVDNLPLDRTEWIHTSGITPALSDSTRKMVDALFTRSREMGVKISFDVNYRPRLWPEKQKAADALLALAQRADVVFVGRDEAEELWGTSTWASTSTILDRPRHLVVKDGAVEAVEVFRDGRKVTSYRVPTPATTVVEVVGAGDAFAGGFLAGLLHGEPPRARLARGHHVAAWTIAGWDDMRPGIIPLPLAARSDADLADHERLHR